MCELALPAEVVVVGGDKFIKGHAEMGLVPQQVDDIPGELLCPLYFILGTFFQANKQKQAENKKTIKSLSFVFTIITAVSRMHKPQQASSSHSKDTQPEMHTLLSLLMV